MILVVGNTKGGAGKSLLACNITAILAGNGKDVLLIDADEQASAATFAGIRAEIPDVPQFATVQLQGRALFQELPRLAKKYPEIVIDCGGRNTESLRAALTRADVALIPFQPRSVDLWAGEQIASLVADARTVRAEGALHALAILNATDPQGRDNSDAAGTLRALEGIDCTSITVGRRKAFPNAFSAGRAVTEYLPSDAKAISEMLSLVSLLYPKEVPNGYQHATQSKAIGPKGGSLRARKQAGVA
jgi:chromosome partitioning protein